MGVSLWEMSACGCSTCLFVSFGMGLCEFNANLSLLSSRLKVPLCINFSTRLVIVLLFILLSVAFSHSDCKIKQLNFNHFTVKGLTFEITDYS